MFTAGEHLPREEAATRQARCQALLAEILPEASGILIFSRINIYYLTGTLGNGILWLPREGEPVLLVRKGEERCRLESPQLQIHSFKSYGEVPGMCAENGAPLGPVVAAEMAALPWALANLLQSRIKNVCFVDGGQAIAMARCVKTPWEMKKIRRAGKRHQRALCMLLPERLHTSMTERAISHTVWEIFFELGHGGMARMGHYGEEIFLGHVSAGENGNYPGLSNSPLGFRGEHPCIPFMGYAGSVWRKGTPLVVDTGFVCEGYHTDMSVTFWAGSESDIPDVVHRAQAVCAEIFTCAAERLRPGAIPADIWRDAMAQAEDAGFAEGFMGLGANKVRFLGHGIGLVMDEVPVVAECCSTPLEEGMVLALEPKIGLPGIGMVGLEHTCEVSSQGGCSLTGDATAIIAIDR